MEKPGRKNIMTLPDLCRDVLWFVWYCDPAAFWSFSCFELSGGERI